MCLNAMTMGNLEDSSGPPWRDLGGLCSFWNWQDTVLARVNLVSAPVAGENYLCVGQDSLNLPH